MYKFIGAADITSSLLPALLTMHLLLGIFFCVCYSVKANLSSFYAEYGVVPDIYDENDKVAEQILTLYVGKDQLINGKVYEAGSLYETPIIQPLVNLEPNAYYTLIYICPDWYTRDSPNLRHYLMWLVTNIPDSNFTKGDTIVEYSPPGPLKMGKRPARYFFALYKQPKGKITVDEPYTENREIGVRQSWSIKKFTQKHNLGDPVAILGIEVVYDKTVPQLQKEYMSFKKTAV